MTKRQMLAECVRLAPDFKLAFHKIESRDCVVATCTLDGKPHELTRVIAPLGRALVETQLLETCLANLRKRAA